MSFSQKYFDAYTYKKKFKNAYYSNTWIAKNENIWNAYQLKTNFTFL